MGKNNDLRLLKIPGKMILGYFVITVILYFFGPFKWKIDNGITLGIYLSVNYFCFWIGYNKYFKYFTPDYEVPYVAKEEINYSSVLFRAVVIFAIASHLLYSFYVYGGISISKIFNMAQSYLDRVGSLYEAKYNFATRIIAYLWGINYIYIPYGIIKFKKLSRIDKTLFFVAIVTDLMYWLSIGTMKGIGDVVILFILPLYVTAITQRKSENQKARTEWRKRKRTILIIALIFVAIFAFNLSQRSLLRGHTASNYIGKNIRAFVDSVNFNVPSSIRSLVFYVSHGYTGLAYAMKLPFEWTYFVGNSRSLTSILEAHFVKNNAISSITYAQRLQDVYGWNNGEIWPSCFTWLASDITFFLIPVLIFLLAHLFSKVVYEAINEQSVISLSFASYLLVFFVYLPCNNQIVQSDRSLFTLIFLALLYFMKRKKVALKIGSHIVSFK